MNKNKEGEFSVESMLLGSVFISLSVFVCLQDTGTFFPTELLFSYLSCPTQQAPLGCDPRLTCRQQYRSHLRYSIQIRSCKKKQPATSQCRNSYEPLAVKRRGAVPKQQWFAITLYFMLWREQEFSLIQ